MSIPNLKFDFADANSPVSKAIELVLSKSLPKETVETVTIYMIHGSPMTNEMSNWEPRLAQALRLFKPEEPLVLIGLIRPDQTRLGESEVFQALTSRPRVRYVDVIGNFLPDITTALDEVRQAEATPLTPIQRVHELRLSISKTELSSIKHDLRHADSGSVKEKELLDRARQSGLVGEDRELRKAIEKFDQIPARLICRGQRFAGIFCDVQGTLLNDEDKVNDRVLSLLKDAEAQNRPVTIWTGGDPTYGTQLVQQAGLSYQVVYKGDFAGATVEEVIDDKLQELKSLYGIIPEREHAP